MTESGARQAGRRPHFPGFDKLVQLKSSTTTENYGRDIVIRWAAQVSSGRENMSVLDIGCGSGNDLLGIQGAVRTKCVRVYGIDVDPHPNEELDGAGISVASCDIERESLPFDDHTLDLVLANQVLEHTKEIFWILAEIHRVLRVGGCVCLGVPNLASLHNRVLLLAGEQPSSIEIIGPHVRGFTLPGLRRLLTWSGHFDMVEVAGSNFYPFPRSWSVRLASRWPGGAVSIFALARKTGQSGSFLNTIQPDMRRATPFYEGSRARHANTPVA